MTFVYPAFLWALLALAIPIIIHLFNFRRYKKVYFTNVKFLRELEIEQKTRSRLKEWLILLTRLITIASLVLAFAQPFLPGKNTSGLNAVTAIYIDNSFSMQRVNGNGPLFDLARERAKEIVKRTPSSSKFYLITNAFEGKHQRLFSKEDALAEIDQIKIHPAPKALPQVINRLQEFLRGVPSGNREAWLLSDLQKNTFLLQNLQPDTSILYTVLPFTAEQSVNVYIDSCWFSSPIQQKGFIQTLHVRLKNEGEQPVESGGARLILNDRQTAVNSYSIPPKQAAELLFSFECKEDGNVFGEVSIEDFPVNHDDKFFFAFQPGLRIPVTVISEAGKELPFRTLLGRDSLFQPTFYSDKGIDYAQLRKSRFIVLNQIKEAGSGLLDELQLIRNAGAAIAVIPSLSSYTANQVLANRLQLPSFQLVDTMRLKCDLVESNSPFFDGVFEKLENRTNLPQVNKHFKIPTPQGVDVLMRLTNGDPLLLAQSQIAPLYLFSTGFAEQESNFARHALFVPVFYKMAFSGVAIRPLYQTAGEATSIFIQNWSRSEKPPVVRSIKKDLEIIPEVRTKGSGVELNSRGQLTSPGFYELLQGDKVVLPLAINYSRVESVMASYTPDEARTIVAEKQYGRFTISDAADQKVPESVIVSNEGKKFWKLFILLALAGLLAEMVIIRLLK